MIVKTLDEGTLREIGAAFANYDYGDEKGLASLFSSRAATAEYIYGYARRVRSARCACAVPCVFSSARRLNRLMALGAHGGSGDGSSWSGPPKRP